MLMTAACPGSSAPSFQSRPSWQKRSSQTQSSLYSTFSEHRGNTHDITWAIKRKHWSGAASHHALSQAWASTALDPHFSSLIERFLGYKLSFPCLLLFHRTSLAHVLCRVVQLNLGKCVHHRCFWSQESPGSLFFFFPVMLCSMGS